MSQWIFAFRLSIIKHYNRDKFWLLRSVKTNRDILRFRRAGEAAEYRINLSRVARVPISQTLYSSGADKDPVRNGTVSTNINQVRHMHIRKRERWRGRERELRYAYIEHNRQVDIRIHLDRQFRRFETTIRDKMRCVFAATIFSTTLNASSTPTHRVYAAYRLRI